MENHPLLDFDCAHIDIPGEEGVEIYVSKSGDLCFTQRDHEREESVVIYLSLRQALVLKKNLVSLIKIMKSVEQ